jgi:hypothetical protein
MVKTRVISVSSWLVWDMFYRGVSRGNWSQLSTLTVS